MPYLCCLCGELSNTEQELCQYCLPILPWIHDRCYRCGLMLQGNDESVYCKRCFEIPPPYERLCALFSYMPPATKLITGLKFGQQLAYGNLLGKLLCDKVLDEWYKEDVFPEVVIPMPLHRKRLCKRGYNQALELLLPLKRQGKLKIMSNLCVRIRATKPQSGLKKIQRYRNIRHAFVLKKRIRFKHVAVMDDVVTTGSTVHALCEVLKKAGVERIDVWCICRA